MTSERMLLGKQRDIVAALCKRRNLLERADDGGRRPPLQIIAGIRATPHEQAKCLSGWFFGTDGDNRLGRVAEDWRAAGRVRLVECFSVAFIRSAPRAVKQSYA